MRSNAGRLMQRRIPRHGFTVDEHPESGNVVFFILLAIVLIGLVTVAIRSGGEGANIDKEALVIRASEIRQYASELERGVAFILQDGASETELLFGHPDANAAYGSITINPTRQVFGDSGGGAQYRLPPADITTAAGWEFLGNTQIPGVGVSDAGARRGDLIALLPGVSKSFCDKINIMNGQITTPTEAGTCSLIDTGLRFGSANQYVDGVGANTLDEGSFTVTPAMQACVQCDGPVYHFYHVLLAR